MKHTSLQIIAAAFAIACGAASAATTTYSFTGVVTYSEGAGKVGRYVTGTYTINTNSADQMIGFGPGAVSPWAVGSSGVPYNPVFADEVRGLSGLLYASQTSAPALDPDDASVITGSEWTFTASEATPAFDDKSYFTIGSEDMSAGYDVDSNGVPVSLRPSYHGEGGFVFGTARVAYRLTSLSAGAALSVSQGFSNLLATLQGADVERDLARYIDRAEQQSMAGNPAEACRSVDDFLRNLEHDNEDRVLTKVLRVDISRQAEALAARLGCS